MKVIILSEFSYQKFPLTRKVKRTREIQVEVKPEKVIEPTEEDLAHAAQPLEPKIIPAVYETKVEEYEEEEPLGNIVEIDDADIAEIGKTKKFDVTNQVVVDYIPPAPTKIKSIKELIKEQEDNKPIQQKYEELVESKIRAKYSVAKELSILRQQNMDEAHKARYNEYNSYCEQCCIDARKELGIK